jgi:hypothetical protein
LSAHLKILVLPGADFEAAADPAEALGGVGGGFVAADGAFGEAAGLLGFSETESGLDQIVGNAWFGIGGRFPLHESSFLL